MILAAVILFSLACAVASARRLFFVIEATPIDPGALATLLRRAPSTGPAAPLVELGAALADTPRADWERDLVAALREPGDARSAMLGEVMTELDFRTSRWTKVPRVSASLASSFGFLAATVSLRVALSELVGSLDDARVASVNGAILDAVDVAAVGFAGAALCAAMHYQARAALRARLGGAERLVDFLGELPDGEASAFAEHGRHASVAPPNTTETTDTVGPPLV